LEQNTPNINGLAGFKLLSRMSQDEYNLYGSILGLTLDSPNSIRWNPTAYQANNSAGSAFVYPGGSDSMTISGAFCGGAGMTDNVLGGEFIDKYNAGLYARLKNITDTNTIGVAIANASNIMGNDQSNGLLSINNLTADFASYTCIKNKFIVTYDTAIIRGADLFPSFESIGLVKKIEMTIRLTINVGVVASYTQFSNGSPMMLSSATSSTYSNQTCPFIQCALQTESCTDQRGIVTSLCIAKTATTSMWGINLGESNGTHPITSCRFYVSQISLEGNNELLYKQDNMMKKLVYERAQFTQLNNLGVGATFNQVIAQGARNPKYILIMPFVSATANGVVSKANTKFPSGVISQPCYQTTSFSAPNSNGPISLINLQAQLGGQNIFQNALSYGFENFLEQIVSADDEGNMFQNVGLYDAYRWKNQSRFYYIDCSRANVVDNGQMRSVTVSFQNNTMQPLDAWIYLVYSQEATIDVNSGLLKLVN
jgi:hypothetical protein